MRWLVIVATLLFACSNAAAQAGAPVAAIPIVRTWVKFTDPNEDAFEVEVPRNWKVQGGTLRRNALQYRSWVSVTSPDARTTLALNDPTEWSYVVPTPMLAASGLQEGSIYSGGGGTTYTVARYLNGAQFAAQWGRRKLRSRCSAIKLVQNRGRPELARAINAYSNGYGIFHDAGEASFTCTKGSEQFTAYALTDVVSTRGQLGAIWYAESMAAFLAPSAVAGVAAGDLAHMLRSVKLNPQWVARNSRSAMQVSATAARTNAAISDSIMKGWEDRGAIIDHVMEQGSRERLGIDVYSDPATGGQYTVSNNYKYYWVNPSGTVVGTQTDTAPTGFTRLTHVPPR